MNRLAVLALAVAIPAQDRIGTREQRAALFDQLLQKTLAREAFSPIKNQRLGIDIGRDMRALRPELLDASTEHELILALMKLSCARKDRHLKVELVPGGLDPKLDNLEGAAPIRFAADFGEQRQCFVADLGARLDTDASIGDVVVGVHGMSFDAWRETVTPYLRYSTATGLWRELGRALPIRTVLQPMALNPDVARYRLRRPDGTEFEIELEYADEDTIEWQGHSEPRYPGFEKTLDLPTFALFENRERRVLVLRWHGFREKLVEDVDQLMSYAQSNRLLDYDLIWDGTRSRGGSRGAYAVQRLFPKPFKTTFGNLRLSDAVPLFIERTKRRFEADRVEDGGVPETMDSGSWLLDWLTDDVTKGMQAGQAYSNDVPFKLAHLPKYSDGIIRPAAVHFRGRAVCLLGPHGGSHLDQFASIVVDNGLAHTIGTSTGGYSNTWEWEEVLTLPGTEQPLVKYMWSIGHTIRPNGEILEGNPAEVDEDFPVTAANYPTYYEQLIERALRHFER